MALSDIELIQRTLDGDQAAFGFLVDKYKGLVHGPSLPQTEGFPPC